ncbi:MAG: hypothetical protein J6A59_06375 [Lachnospiraceae bacterium]|nr:hypothetical protein [Lachnospiraceae bacterium]
MKNCKESRKIELNLDEMAEAIVKGLIEKGTIQVNSDMDIHMDYKATQNESGCIVVTGCSLTIVDK